VSNVGRVLTLRVKIHDEEAAKWIWEAHRVPDHPCGVRVGAISNDDLFVENDKQREWLDRLLDSYAGDGREADEVSEEIEEYERQQVQKENG
jgi:hypothetical protein